MKLNFRPQKRSLLNQRILDFIQQLFPNEPSFRNFFIEDCQIFVDLFFENRDLVILCCPHDLSLQHLIEKKIKLEQLGYSLAVALAFEAPFFQPSFLHKLNYLGFKSYFFVDKTGECFIDLRACYQERAPSKSQRLSLELCYLQHPLRHKKTQAYVLNSFIDKIKALITRL